jgi:hypothetical protein
LVLKVSSRLIVFLEFEISVGDIVIDVLYSGAEEARDNPENCLKLNNAFYNHLKHIPFLPEVALAVIAASICPSIDFLNIVNAFA